MTLKSKILNQIPRWMFRVVRREKHQTVSFLFSENAARRLSKELSEIKKGDTLTVDTVDSTIFISIKK